MRPVPVVTRQAVIEHPDKLTVVDVTTKGKGYPIEVVIDHCGKPRTIVLALVLKEAGEEI